MRPVAEGALSLLRNGRKMQAQVENHSWPLTAPTPKLRLHLPGHDTNSKSSPFSKYETFYTGMRHCEIPIDQFPDYKQIWLEIGSGSGTFFLELAKRNPQNLLMAIERDRMRAKSLLKRTEKRDLDNLVSFRGNIIPTVINGIPWESLDRIYILYPCPWPKRRHTKHRWYFHPVMPHLVKTLKKGGRIVWASDSGHYIDEARCVCEQYYSLKSLAHGRLTPNPYNDLEIMPEGRTKFETAFLKSGKNCYELIVEKMDAPEPE